MRTYSIWLTGIILLTVFAFLAVFQPVTFTPRKDPSDPTRYLRPLNVVGEFEPTKPPKTVELWKDTYLYLYTPQHDIRLGLDLRGGMRVVLEIPDRAEFVYPFKVKLTGGATEATEKQQRLAEALATPEALGEEAKDPQQVKIVVNENEARVVTLPKRAIDATDQLTRINAAVATVFPEGSYKEPDPKTVFKPVDVSTQDSVRGIMERRVNPDGTREVISNTKGENQVVLEIPGERDPEAVKETLRTTAQLEFRLITEPGISVSTDHGSGLTIVTRDGEQISHSEALKGTYLVVSGSSLKDNCDVTLDQGGEPAVSFEISSTADRERFYNITASNARVGNQPGKQLAIVLDNEIVTAPEIRDAIRGNGIISGGFRDMKEAKKLADLLNAGALPVPVKIVENRTVSATLGEDSVRLSIIAGFIGLAAVLVFMVAYYRLPGLMANLALIIYLFLVLAVMWLFPNFTLTLPGIAGIIISLGMAVDANIIIFERLKEELRSQKPLDRALDVAFSRAWTAILDSNVASLITGAVLYALGTGAVRGFAVALLIGVAVSLFTAVTVTRLLMKLVIRTKAGHNLAWYGV